MGFIKDIVKGIGKAIKGIVSAIGDVFEAVGDAISGLMDNPIMLIAAAALGFAAAPALGAMLGGTTAAGAAAAGATAAVETVAGGASLGTFGSAVLGTGAELVGGAAGFGAASGAAAAATGGLLADAASGMLTNLPVSAGGNLITGVGGDMAATLTGGAGSDMLLAGGSDMLVNMPSANALGTLTDSSGFLTQLPTGAGSAVAEAGSGGFWNSITSGVGDFLKSPIDWMKSNKELVKMIGDGIQGWQKEEMEREKLDWQKEVYDQQQANWEAIHQPYDFSLYDPGAALQAMNQNLANNGYMSQAAQLQQAGYQPQFAVNQPYPYAMPNYDRMVAATYGKSQEQTPA